MLLTPSHKRRLAQLRQEKNLSFQILSGSMEPTIKIGDWVSIIEAPVRLGDIIALYLVSGDILIHRYQGLKGGEIISQGDQSKSYEQLPQNHLLGRVYQLTRQGNTFALKRSLFQYLRCWWQGPQRIWRQNRFYQNFQLQKLIKNPHLCDIKHLNSQYQIILFDCFSKKTLLFEDKILKSFPTASIFSAQFHQKPFSLELSWQLFRQKDYFKLYYLLKKGFERSETMGQDQIQISLQGHPFLPIRALRESLLAPPSSQQETSLTELFAALLHHLNP